MRQQQQPKPVKPKTIPLAANDPIQSRQLDGLTYEYFCAFTDYLVSVGVTSSLTWEETLAIPNRHEAMRAGVAKVVRSLQRER